MAQIILPRDWERVDCSTFAVLLCGLEEGHHTCVLWNAEDLQKYAPKSCTKHAVSIVEPCHSGIWKAIFTDLEITGNLVIGLLKEGDSRPIAVSGVRLGISDTMSVLRTTALIKGAVDLQYPIPIVWNRSSNWFYPDGEIPTVYAKSIDDRGEENEGPLIVRVHDREAHDARPRLLLQYCIGKETKAFQEEYSKGEWASAPVYFAIFRNVDVLMYQGVVLDKVGIWNDSAYAALHNKDRLAQYPDLFYHNGKFGRIDVRQPKPEILGRSYIISNAGFGNFGHWMLNSFFSAYLLRDEIIKNDGRILCPPLPFFARESLQLLGLADRLVEREDRCLRVEHLVYPSPLSTHANMMPSNLTIKMVEDLKTAAAKDSRYLQIEAPELIYLTRQGFPSSRTLSNEAKLIKEMNIIGFKTVATHDLTFIERIRLFSNAKVVIGQLGASLSHVLFMPKGCVVVEITNPGWHSNEFWYLASLLKIWFVRFMIEVDPAKSIRKGEFSFEVSVADVVRTVKELIRDHGTWDAGN